MAGTVYKVEDGELWLSDRVLTSRNGLKKLRRQTLNKFSNGWIIGKVPWPRADNYYSVLKDNGGDCWNCN